MPLKVLIPLPRKDFDPTEAGVPWKILTAGGVRITFATPHGEAGAADTRMVTGKGLGPFKKILMASSGAQQAYAEMAGSAEFRQPQKWSSVAHSDFDGLLLPGGHARGMREYLESAILQKLVADFFAAQKPVAAICHGVVLAGRSKIAGKSVLCGKKTTALLASQEMLAWALTCLWLGSYYRTYSQTVQHEVTSYLNSFQDFIQGPRPFLRDDLENLERGFVVIDDAYVSSRWPGDAHRFATTFLGILKTRAPK